MRTGMINIPRKNEIESTAEPSRRCLAPNVGFRVWSRDQWLTQCQDFLFNVERVVNRSLNFS
jgi:uncharacterized protein CbrC (UPF0167 family)